MTKTVTAYEARTNFGKIIDRVYYAGDEFIVTKTGRPVVKIIKAEVKVKTDFESIWKKMRQIAKSGKKINAAKFIRKDRESGHKIYP